MSDDLTKVDSAVAGLSISNKDEKEDKSAKKGKEAKRVTADTGVRNINDLEAEGVKLELAPETQKLNWKLNTSPASLDEKDALKKFLTKPPVKKIDLHFPLGLEVTARNLKGVTVKDALDAIYKQYKKKADDELENPILAGFEWDPEESWTKLIVHQKREATSSGGGGKKKKKGGDE